MIRSSCSVRGRTRACCVRCGVRLTWTPGIWRWWRSDHDIWCCTRRESYARLVNALLRVLNRQKPRDVLTEWWLGSDSTVYLHVQSIQTRSYLRALVHGTQLAAVDFRQSESMFKLTLGGLTVLLLHFQEEIPVG